MLLNFSSIVATKLRWNKARPQGHLCRTRRALLRWFRMPLGCSAEVKLYREVLSKRWAPLFGVPWIDRNKPFLVLKILLKDPPRMPTWDRAIKDATQTFKRHNDRIFPDLRQKWAWILIWAEATKTLNIKVKQPINRRAEIWKPIVKVIPVANHF